MCYPCRRSEVLPMSPVAQTAGPVPAEAGWVAVAIGHDPPPGRPPADHPPPSGEGSSLLAAPASVSSLRQRLLSRPLVCDVHYFTIASASFHTLRSTSRS